MDVLCWDGRTKKARDIQVGDVIIGDDGLQRVVVNTCSGMSPMYRIEQSLGVEYEVSCEHLITVRCNGKDLVHPGDPSAGRSIAARFCQDPRR